MKLNTSKRLLASVAMVSAASSFSTLVSAQSLDQLNAKAAAIYTEVEMSLSGGASVAFARPEQAVSNFIAAETGQPEPTLIMSGSFTGSNGVKHVRMHQTVDGLRVHGAYVRAAMRDGNVSHLIERTSPANGKKLKSSISRKRAINIAVRKNFGAGKPAAFFHKAPRAERVYIARRDGILQEGFLVENWSRSDNQLYYTLVNGKGRIMDNELRTSQDSYNIFADNPDVSTQTVVTNPADAVASPSGWLSGPQTTLTITGNNVSAYLDRDNDNSSDGGGTAVTDGNFTADHFPLQDPTFSDNQDVAVQNLFYFNNLIHDDLYHHGFTESTFNFQEDNFGKGGAGGDPVDAEAQDGGGTNNANFATPSDGFNPRMQMYLWTNANPDRDGDLDSDIIWHEYGHGLTWRMIGNMSGPISGAIGEGMSDVLSILHNNDDVVGEYSTANPNGIRSEPYTNYSRTFGDFTGNSVHFDGEIYAATIWRLAELSNAAGMDNEAVLDVVIDGMNFTPSQPSYIDMRDGILAAAPESYDCTVWQAFADFGMGDGVGGTTGGASNGAASNGPRPGGNPRNRGGQQGNTPTTTTGESFDVPASCGGGGGTDPGPDPDPDPNTVVSVDGVSGSATSGGGRIWSATATASIVDINSGAAAAGITVGGRWSTGDDATCVTDSSGSCSVDRVNLKLTKNTSVTYTILTLDGLGATGLSLTETIASP